MARNPFEMLERFHPDNEISAVVEVLLVGGPLHGVRTVMSKPNARITLERPEGQAIAYLRSTAMHDGPRTETYVREGIASDEVEVLVNDARTHGPWL